jgi:DNA-binding MarR family transcriptional regulator
MISIRVGTNDLAALRFATDAVWETTASLNVVTFPRQHALHDRLRSRLPDHPRYDMELLRELTSHRHWLPDTLAPQPSSKPADPVDQLWMVRETPPDVVGADLAALRSVRPDSRVASMCPDEFVESVATALVGYWTAVLEPLWGRIQAVTEADIAHHATGLAQEGFGSAIAGVHPELAYRDGEVTIAMSSRRRIDASGQGVWFVPSVFRWPWLTVGLDGRCPVVSYASRGAARIWEPTGPMKDVLTSLLGRTRAAVLARLDVPRTTTELADRLGIAPGTVSFHLGVLTASGLTESRRAGRRVLYEQSVLGAQLVSGNG